MVGIIYHKYDSLLIRKEIFEIQVELNIIIKEVIIDWLLSAY